MSKNYVIDGAKIKCTMGDKSASLKVTSNFKYKIQGKKVATMLDFVPGPNLFPPVGTFGTCKPYKTSPMPLCTPMPAGPWQSANVKQMIQGKPALMEDCFLICPRAGGKISIEKTTQKSGK